MGRVAAVKKGERRGSQLSVHNPPTRASHREATQIQPPWFHTRTWAIGVAAQGWRSGCIRHRPAPLSPAAADEGGRKKDPHAPACRAQSRPAAW